MSEPLLMPLTALFRYGEGTLSGFSFRGNLPGMCVTVQSCFISSGGCP